MPPYIVTHLFDKRPSFVPEGRPFFPFGGQRLLAMGLTECCGIRYAPYERHGLTVISLF
ncbi:hypothetical protein [Sutterella wadsworthensis]|jgi:hypothetical protein|uniref:hypothetical protein n=1 Tax=Sutterella wadsworthensis TaxID=40545 RepID=UPI0032BF9ACD